MTKDATEPVVTETAAVVTKVPKPARPKKHEPRASKPSDWICTHSSTASGFYALEVLDRLHKAGKITLDEVKSLVLEYEKEQG